MAAIAGFFDPYQREKITNEYDRPEFYQLLISRSTHVFQFPFQVLQYKIRMCFAVENKY